MLLRERSELTKVGDESGDNALHYSARKNNGKIVELLLLNKAALAYTMNRDGRTPLHVAATCNSGVAIREILKHCPDAAEQVDKAGRNALHIAVLSRTLDALTCLMKCIHAEEIVNQADNDGNTPLHLAAKNSRVHIHSPLLLLKDKRVDPCVLNAKGHTPRMLIESLEEIDSYEMYVLQSLKKSEQSRCKNHHDHALSSKLSMSRKSFMKNMASEEGRFKSCVETYTLVATLIATVTFAAIFTMPGGYDQGEGYPLLAKHGAFQVFVIAEAVAMCSSLLVVFCFLWAWKDPMRFKFEQLVWGHRLTVVASLAMIVALMSAVYVVLDKQCKWVAVVVCIICCSAPFLLWTILGRDILFIPV